MFGTFSVSGESGALTLSIGAELVVVDFSSKLP